MQFWDEKLITLTVEVALTQIWIPSVGAKRAVCAGRRLMRYKVHGILRAAGYLRQ